MNPLPRRMILVPLLAAAALALAAPPSGASVRSADALLEWIARHPENAGVAAVRPENGRVELAASPGRLTPLGSVRKVLVLGAYADAVAAGRLDPAERVPVAAVERWYWPGTDGGAHPLAVEEWQQRGTLRGGAVPLDEVARAAIRWSDNSAADYLLTRVGRRATARFARRHGLRRQQPLAPQFGEYLAWAKRTPAAWRALTPRERARAAQRLARRTSAAEAAATPLPSIAVQRRFAALSTAGTPLEWARLMARISTGRGLAPVARAVMRRHLEWPTEDPATRELADPFGTKGGSLPGVIAEASYLTPAGGRPLAVAVLLRDLPRPVERDLSETFAHQQLILRLAADPEFLAKARELLMPAPRGG